MIYQYLLPIEPVHITREYFRSGMDPVTKLHCYDATRWREVHHPQHFWDAQYVTPGFLAELKERYYLTTTFTFGDDEGVIERFLTTDHLDLGFGPVDLVSMVEVHLTALTFDRSCCMSYLFGLATKPERLEAAIRGLEKLRSGTNVVVKFNTRAKDEEQRTSQAETARKSLAPGLERVRERGCSVSFVIDGSVETDVVSGAKSR